MPARSDSRNWSAGIFARLSFASEKSRGPGMPALQIDFAHLLKDSIPFNVDFERTFFAFYYALSIADARNRSATFIKPSASARSSAVSPSSF
jgi:hypothetical protein